MIENIYEKFNIDKKILDFVNDIEKDLDFSYINNIEEYNQLKVLDAFIKNKVSDSHFFESTGYGYDDNGRDIIEKVYSNIFNTEDALVRQQIISGTHALAISLFALTKSGDEILSINGLPYDTLHRVIGLNNEIGSLIDNGRKFDVIELKNEKFDYDGIKNKIKTNTKLIIIQRSKGYTTRHAFSIDEIKNVIDYIRTINKNINILVDNCYGEFVDKLEPSDIGADIVVGSLIKNIGGGIAKSGGYIVGRKDLIELCAYRLTAPGIGKEIGSSHNENRNVLLGLSIAPTIVSNILKAQKLYIKVYEKLGYETYPKFNEEQNDIVLAIKLNDRNKLINFTNAIQHSSFIDSYANTLFSLMPGYENKVIMASGSFTQGSSIELSCDGPDVSPYIAYFQGGMSYYQIKLSLLMSIKYLNNDKF